MSIGPIYTLINNTGVQDQLLLATELLNNRLREIRRLRSKNPTIKDKTPTLVDIEKTHVLFLNSHFKPFCALAYIYNAQGAANIIPDFGKEVIYSIPQYGDFFSDMVLHVRLEGLSKGIASDQVRYCDFLGHRLLKQVQFEVNGNLIDQYDSDMYNLHYNFFVNGSRKELSWKRSVGQETPNIGFVTQNPLVDNYRQQINIMNGPQTPKATHSSVDIWVPILFWFNIDQRLAIPSAAIPYGQRFIKIFFADVEEICQGVPTPDFTAPKMTICDLWINNLFVNPEILDIYLKRIGFQLIRIHRYQKIPLTEPSGRILLNQLKFPTETFYFGARPNINDGNMTDWWRFHYVTNNTIPWPVSSINPVPPPANLITVGSATYKTATRILDTLSIVSHDIVLANTTPAGFYNFVVPYKMGDNITSPLDPGAYMVAFNLYPGNYQPSGYINLSNSREFYLNYTGSTISEINPSYLKIYGVSINFMIIAQGQCSLRFNV